MGGTWAFPIRRNSDSIPGDATSYLQFGCCGPCAKFPCLFFTSNTGLPMCLSPAGSSFSLIKGWVGWWWTDDGCFSSSLC